MSLFESFERDGHVLVRGIASREQIAGYRPIIKSVVDNMKHDPQGRIDD